MNFYISDEEVAAQTTTVPSNAKTIGASTATSDKAPSRRPDGDRPQRRQGGAGGKFERRASEYEEKLVEVNRVATVVKGGRRFSFSAIVVIGNKKGKVGYGHGKANEVPNAIKKAIKDAQRNVITVPIINESTIPHETSAKFVASKVLLKPAPRGRGLIASGSVRAVVELAGYKDIVTKSLGSANKTNVVKAALAALSKLATSREIALRRDLDSKIFAKKKNTEAPAVTVAVAKAEN